MSATVCARILVLPPQWMLPDMQVESRCGLGPEMLFLNFWKRFVGWTLGRSNVQVKGSPYMYVGCVVQCSSMRLSLFDRRNEGDEGSHDSVAESAIETRVRICNQVRSDLSFALLLLGSASCGQGALGCRSSLVLEPRGGETYPKRIESPVGIK